MHLPKLVLEARGFSSMGRGHCILVHLAQRKVMEHEMNLGAVLVLDFFQFRIQPATRRTLIVAIFFD